MSRAYKFRDITKPYFVSFATVLWIDLFTRKEYCHLFLESVRYCQENKGLIVYAWIIMPSHIHLIIGTKDLPMQDILRDLKSHTSRKLKEAIKTHPTESRKEWLIWMFERAGKINGNNKSWQLWQQHNKPIELWDNYMIENKLNYLHNNPVEAEVVSKPEDYVWSSAIDYSGTKGLIDVEILE